jgi:N-acetylglutamate synthase-like GNAT family acetyltransferase
MRRLADEPLPVVEAFDEQQFYLDEFRGHTLLFSIPIEELGQEGNYERLAATARALLRNDTRVLLLISVPDVSRGKPVRRQLQRRLDALLRRDETTRAQRRGRSSAFAQLDSDALADPVRATAVLSTVWTTLRCGPLFVGIIPETSRERATLFAQELAVRLRVHKLILIEPDGGVTGNDGKPFSFMDDNMLITLLGAGQAEWAGLADRRATLEAVRAALRDGVASVNLCSLAGAARELFTYEGSGTLFTVADYCKVERLGIDDFEEVERLIERGQREGVLKMRTPDEITSMLMHGYGATIGARHLAGICAMLWEPYATARAAEIVGLYAITRFKGEGVGAHLLARCAQDARAAHLAYVFACTTEERAQGLFERHGFRRVPADDVPAAKWACYDPQRKKQVAVYRLDLRYPEPE